MKYQAGLDKTKQYLKEIPETEIVEICNSAGLTERETKMVVLKFRKGKQRLHASDDVGMSESRFSVKMTAILKILKKVLTKSGFIDE